MAPQGAGYRSTLRVRLIHALVRRHVAAMPDWRADEWGLPINQTDMAATLWDALVAPSAWQPGSGHRDGTQGYDGIAQPDPLVGWLIGVHDEWLPRTTATASGCCSTH
jgi:hypothetical protein